MSIGNTLNSDSASNVIPSVEDNISINTMGDNLPSILLRDPPFPEPYSLSIPFRNSIGSAISDQISVNEYFINHNPTNSMNSGLEYNGSFERTKTIITKDRKDKVEEIADRAIQVIKDARSKLTRLITDVSVLFPFLKEKVILTEDDCDVIDQQRLRSLKTDKFIDIIVTRGPKGVAYFFESLKEHYNHVYLSLRNIFELRGIEIEAILNNNIKRLGRVSKYFHSIEEILGPEFSRGRNDAKNLLESISAVKMDNVTYQEIQELKEKYLELQKHYEPIQSMIDDVSRDLMIRYNNFLIENECLNSENRAALITIDKLLEENRQYHDKVQSQNVKMEQLQQDIDRCTGINDEVEQKFSNYKKIMELKPSTEKLELLKLHQELQKENDKNKELSEQIDAIRIQKNDIFGENQKNLSENAELKKQVKALEIAKKRTYDESSLKSSDKHLDKFEEVKNTLTRTKQVIDGALTKITGKNSVCKEVIVRNTIPIGNSVKDHLSQSLEIGVFFSDNLDPSIVRSFQPGDRIVKINNIKLTNISSPKHAKFMMQQAENELKLLITRGSLSLGNIPCEEHNFRLTDDDLYISRCASPNSTIIDNNRLTPVPSMCNSCSSNLFMDFQRRISQQSQNPISIKSGFASINSRTGIHNSNDILNDSSDVQLDIPTRNILPYDVNITTSCPQTPLFNSSDSDYKFKPLPRNKTDRRKVVASVDASDSESSDTFSQDSGNNQPAKPPPISRPNSLPSTIKLDNEGNTYAQQQFEPVASPNVQRNFRIDDFDSVSDLFNNGRSDTGLTGMVICARRNPTIRMSESSDFSLVNQDQIRTTVPNQLFLKHGKVSGGFGNPFFLHSNEELHDYKLSPGHKIFQINQLSTEYLTYEIFIDQCHRSSTTILFISHKPSPHYKPEDLSVRDHFYVIPQFTTRRVTLKGELYVSPSCVYLVTDTMHQNDVWSRQNRFWSVTRIDPRNCNTIENGSIPSDLWLSNSIDTEEDSLVESIDSQLMQPPRSLNNSISEDDLNLENVDFYYNLDSVKEKSSVDTSTSPFRCYTLVIRKDLLPQPLILFGYHWEDISEKLATHNSTRESERGSKFKLISPYILENVDYAKNAELEAKQKDCEIIYYRGSDGKTRVVNIKSLTDCAECCNTPVILCPFAQIATAPALVKLNPIVIKLKFKYSSASNKTDLPSDPKFHFDDMLRFGLSEEKYLKKLVSMIDSNRVLYEWKSVYIES